VAQPSEAPLGEARSERGAVSWRLCSYGELWYRAHEIRRVIGAPAAFVLGFLRVGVQRARAVTEAVGGVTGNDHVWSFVLLHPLFERAERVEARRPRPAGAVLHARHHEQAVELLGVVQGVGAVAAHA